MSVLLLAAYATGIALARSVAPWYATGLSVITALLILAWLTMRRSPWSNLPLCGMLLLAGLTNAVQGLHQPSNPHHISRLISDRPLSVEARVVAIERRSIAGYRIVVDALRVFEKGHVKRTDGKILLYTEHGESHVRPGQIIRWRSKLRRPSRFGNPGEFDYPLHLAAQGIHVTGFVSSVEDLVIIINHPQRESAVLGNLRLDMANSIGLSIPEEQDGLLQSLLLGLRGGVSTEQRKILAESGIAHLFAISGLHFGLLALLLYRLGSWLYSRSTRLLLWSPPQKTLPAFLLIPLAGYLILTGNAWATRRAFLMVGLVALQIAYGRRTSPCSLLASVALCILICNPLALFQPGFQLSFTGVAGILAWLPGWQRQLVGLPRTIRWPLMLILTTLAASLATAPATLWHFHLFAPASLLSNMFAVPLIAWGAVPLGLASLAIMPVAAPPAEWLMMTAAWIVDITMTGALGITQTRWFEAIPVYMTPAKLVMLSGILVVILPLRSVRRRTFCRMCVLLTTLVVAYLLRIQPAEFQVIALSVGQGDATLVSFSGDVHYLVDGGGLPGSSIDPGERLIAPALGRLGIDHLDGVILTHNHPDHASGLVYIVERFPVRRFYTSADLAELDTELQAALRRQGVRIARVAEGWSCIRQNDRQELSLFAPDQSASDINERSIAVYASHLGHGVMLTADMGAAGLKQLSDSGAPGEISLLKLPHHGSRYAAPELFLEHFAPLAAFASAGRGNPYGFPHSETVEACTRRGIPFYRTDQMGMLKFHLQDGQWQPPQIPGKGFRID